MNAGSAKKPWLRSALTALVTSRYMRLKQARPSLAGSSPPIASIRATASATDVTGAQVGGEPGVDDIESPLNAWADLAGTQGSYASGRSGGGASAWKRRAGPGSVRAGELLAEQFVRRRRLRSGQPRRPKVW